MEVFINLSSLWIGSGGIGYIAQSYFDSGKTNLSESTLFYQRGFGVSMIAIGLIIFVYNKLKGGRSDNGSSAHEGDTRAHRTTAILTAYYGLTAFYTYTQVVQRLWRNGGDGASFLVYLNCGANSLLFFWGVLLLLFGEDKGKFSKTTGADKRTSNYPFDNAGSARTQKKEFKAKSVAGKVT